MTPEAHRQQEREKLALAQGVALKELAPAEPVKSKTTLVEHMLPEGLELGISSKGGREFVPKDPEENEKTRESRFAVVTCAGTQFKVVPGDRLIVSKLVEAQVGSEYVFDNVLLIGSKEKTFIGRPTITNAKVTAFVEEQTKDAKLIVMKRRTKNHSSRRTKGFRRQVTFLRIDRIEFDEDKFDL